MATEKRLIELIECLEHCANDSPCNQCLRWNHKCDRHCVNDLLDTAAKELKKFVDAVEVVHGRWIWSEENGCWVCSNCEMSALNNYRGNSTDSNFCPNCGAYMMDGDVNG